MNMVERMLADWLMLPEGFDWSWKVQLAAIIATWNITLTMYTI